jgi:hypothetical protein
MSFKNSELEAVVSGNYNILSNIEPDTDLDREVRVEGDGENKKRVHVLIVNEKEFTYDNKHDRNSDYYRLLNVVQRAKKSVEDAKAGTPAAAAA